MPILQKRWEVAPVLPPEADQAIGGPDPILRQILYNRGLRSYEHARRFVRAEIPPGSDPYQMLGMPQAVERIRSAIRNREEIAVYGDYDADGVTATALLTQALQKLGAQVRGYIPNRFDEGYGLNNEALESLKSEGVCLAITVDCGIRSLAEASFAHQIGLDLIISDHHQPGHDLPQALAVINPKQPGDAYPDKDLAGVGLAYKLAMALFDQPGASDEQWPEQSGDYVDLVALGTVADLAPLLGENRALVRAGIKSIRNTRRQGLLSLIGVSGLKQDQINATHIGYGLGPRLNAAGRLDSALAALQLLTDPSLEKAAMIAQQLDDQNRERQRITREMQTHAEALALAADPDPLLLFAADPSYNSGVVGLAASRLTESFYRPAIVAYLGDEYTRGSCRSIPEFHITEALDRCSDLLVRYGGHAAAAGFTVRTENLPQLVERLKEVAREQLGSLDLQPTLRADVELSLADLNPELLRYLDWLQPTGVGNPQAVFVSRNLKVASSRAVGRDKSHLKLTVTDGRGVYFDAIAFRQGHWQESLPALVDLIYTFESNLYNGQSYLQLNVIDMKPSGSPD